jgi:hypothetical protein
MEILGNWFSDVSGMTYAKWNYGVTIDLEKAQWQIAPPLGISIFS